MKGFKKLFVFTVVLALAFSTAACGSGNTAGDSASNGTTIENSSTTAVQPETTQKKDVTLNVLAPFDPKVIGEQYITTIDQVAKEFGYKVNFENIDAETYKTKIKVALTGNELPDIFFTWGDSYAQTFIDAKAVLPLNDAVKKSGNQYMPSYAIPYGDGNIYIAPETVNNFYVLLYNKQVLKSLNMEVPKNWDDILALVAAAKKNDVYAWGLANKDRWQGDLLYNQLVLREDSQAYKNAISGNGSFTDKPFLDAAIKVKQLVDMGAFQKGYLQAGEPEMNEMLYAGKIAMQTIGDWAFTASIDNLKDNLGYAVFPKTGADENYLESDTCMFGNLPSGLFVSAKTQFPEEAAQFVLKYSYYINESLAKRGMLGYMKTDTKPDNAMHPAYEEFTKAAANFKIIQPWWYSVVDGSIGEPMRDLSQKQFAGAIEPEDFVKELQKIMTKKN